MNYILTSDKTQTVDSSTQIQPMQMNIFLAVTIDKLDKFYPLLYSLLKYSQSKFNVYIMLNRRNVQPFYQNFKQYQTDRMTIKLLNNSLLKTFLNNTSPRVLTQMAYAKMLIPTLLPNLDRILYLDYDAIIINRGIEWLYNLDFKDQYLLFGSQRQLNIFDFTKPYNDTYFNGEIEYNQHSLFSHLTDYYFNSGILLFNIKKIIKDGKNIQMLNVLKNPPNSQNNEQMRKVKQQINYTNTLCFYYHDQSMLNWIFRRSKIFFNPIFNSATINVYNDKFIPQEDEYFSQWGFKNKQELVDNVIIAHFAGQKKPWQQSELTTYQKQLCDKYNKITEEMKHD